MGKWQKYAAEAYGTFVLVLFGTAAVVASGGNYLVIALAFGLALVAGLYTVGQVSGGHFNPAVSLGMFLDKRLGLTDMVLYWVSQLIGAVVASLAVAYVGGKVAVAGTVTGVGDLEPIKGMFGEAILTAVFVMTILVMSKASSYLKFLGIGLTLTAVHLAGIGLTGASVNPARSFGPALVAGQWTDFWVYVVGPLIGAVIAWVLFKVIVAADTSLTDEVPEMMG